MNNPPRNSIVPRIKHGLRQPANVAGALYILSALSLLVMWGMVFGYLTLTETPGEIVHFFLIESPDRLWFIWLALLPAPVLGLSAAYFSRLAQSRRGAIALLFASIFLAIVTWISVSLVAISITFPLPYAVMHLRRVLRG